MMKGSPASRHQPPSMSSRTASGRLNLRTSSLGNTRSSNFLFDQVRPSTCSRKAASDRVQQSSAKSSDNFVQVIVRPERRQRDLIAPAVAASTSRANGEVRLTAVHVWATTPRTAADHDDGAMPAAGADDEVAVRPNMDWPVRSGPIRRTGVGYCGNLQLGGGGVLEGRRLWGRRPSAVSEGGHAAEPAVGIGRSRASTCAGSSRMSVGPNL